MYVLDELNDRRTGLKRWNSCSTVYLDDSTISQPHLKHTVMCLSLAVYYHIANRNNRGRERLMEIFEERLHPILVGFFLVLIRFICFWTFLDFYLSYTS